MRQEPFRHALRLFATIGVVALTVSLLPAPAGAQQQAELTTELVKVTNATLQGAHQLAMGVCQSAERNSAERNTECSDIRYLEDENMLAITATPQVIARIRALLADFDRPPETRSFQIIVLAASRSGASSPEVPANVQQALRDLQEFLPYTAFSVVGSGWLRTSSYGTTTLPGDEGFIAEMQFRPTTDATAPLLIENFSVYRRVPVSTPVEGGYTTQYTRRNVLQTTFTIDPGETVVVGTSKLNGDDTAVVVLLTAVQN